MWRAFFFAVGTILVILGLQCLAVDQFFVNQNGKVSGLVNKALNVIDPQKNDGQGPNFANLGNPGAANQNGGFSLPQTAGSQYGPSRFQASPYSQGQINSGNPANYGGNQFQSAGFRQSEDSSSAISNKPPRILKTKDWMPWCLIAFGTIIALYTNATTKNSHHRSAD